MKPVFTIRDILDYMESGQVFSITAVAYDRKRKKGGSLKEYPEAVLLHVADQVEVARETGRPLTTMEATRLKMENIRRSPRHGTHFTRNIRILQQGEPTGIVEKIHVPLIIRFNGCAVVP